MKYIISGFILAAAMNSAIAAPSIAALPIKAPKNIIMIIGDGMGPAYTTGYRYFHDDPNTPQIEQTVFDRHLKGLSSTYPAPVSGYITDSAAGATALSTGIKSYNGAIGVDVHKKRIETVLEWAKAHGKKTGVVVTSQINHATPAGYLAHNESRENYDAIADSYFDDRINKHIKFDVAFGGGWRYFIRKDRNLVAQFKQAGFQYIDKLSQLTSLSADKPALGLFADKGLPWALDDKHPHRLAMMTKTATRLLENKHGYFMLIEGSQIDWGGHANDIAAAMGEMDDLAKTLEYLEVYVKKHPDTLVVVTADHSTGGLSLGANGVYQWRPAMLRNMKHSPIMIAKTLAQSPINAATTRALFNSTLTNDEITLLQNTKRDPSSQLVSHNKHGNPYADMHADKVKKALYKAIKQIINARTNTGWTSSGHTAVDVPVFAFGSHSTQFNGKEDNTDIAKHIFSLLGKQ